VKGPCLARSAHARVRGTAIESRINARTMIKGVRETLGSALCFVAVLAALVSVDPRVRMKVSSVLEDPAGGMVAPWGDRLGDLGSALFDAARDQSLENAPLLIFGFVGAMLLLFMLRT
jgi:hypothetical protein